MAKLKHMKNNSTSIQDRKKLSRLENELKKLEDKAYKMDGCEFDDELWNARYTSKQNEYLRLKQQFKKSTVRLPE